MTKRELWNSQFELKITGWDCVNEVNGSKILTQKCSAVVIFKQIGGGGDV